MDPQNVRDRIRKFAKAPQYEPIILKDDITPDELAFIEAHHVELPELDTIMAHRRLYPKNGFMAHLVGYVGEVSEEMLTTHSGSSTIPATWSASPAWNCSTTTG